MNILVRRIILICGISALVVFTPLGILLLLIWCAASVTEWLAERAGITPAQVAAEQKRERERIIAWKSIP